MTSIIVQAYPTSQSPITYLVVKLTISGIIIKLEKLDLFSKKDNMIESTITNKIVCGIRDIYIKSYIFSSTFTYLTSVMSGFAISNVIFLIYSLTSNTFRSFKYPEFIAESSNNISVSFTLKFILLKFK